MVIAVPPPRATARGLAHPLSSPAPDARTATPRGRFLRRGLGAGLLAALALAGCTSAESAGAVAGDYNGMLAVEHREQLRSVFGSLHLRIGGDGALIQSELVTTSPTSVVGEHGPATGMVIPRDSVANDADLTLALPTLGTYHLTGTLIYAETTRALSGMLTTRDDSGAVIGSTLIAVMK